MDRAQHYREAERLLGMCTGVDGDPPVDDEGAAAVMPSLIAAQVHATLATVPALSASDIGQWAGFEAPAEDSR